MLCEEILNVLSKEILNMLCKEILNMSCEKTLSMLRLFFLLKNRNKDRKIKVVVPKYKK